MANDVTADLIHALVDNMRGTADDWQSLSIVISFDDDRISGTSGYAYSPDGVISAVASRPSGVQPAVEAYTASYYKPGEPLPVKLLVQFDRTTGKYEVTFEDTDVSRWNVSAANIEQLREELRPKFG